MPETPQFHQEAPVPEAQERILTPEDFRRLNGLLWETRERDPYNPLFSGYRDELSVALRLRWRNEGRKASEYLFNLIEDDPNLNNNKSFQHAYLLGLCASPDDTQRIGALLLRDDVALAEDRSFKGRFLEILERISTPKDTDQLVQFVGKCMDAPYNDDLKKEDTMEAIGILWAIGLRADLEYGSEDGDERSHDTHTQLGNAGQKIKENLRARTGIEITDEEEQLLAERLFFQDRDSRFMRLFEIQEPEQERYNAYDTEDERNMSREDEDDDEARYDYRENRLREVESRIEVVKRLRYEAKKGQEIQEDPEDDDGTFLRRHWLEYREEHPSPYTPTLGIEIEIREQSAVPPEVEPWDKDEFLEDKKKMYERTEELGVPAGNDKFWEFAHAPVHYYATLSREVQALIEMGLINPQYPRHPLHITIGGITLGKSMEDLYDEVAGREGRREVSETANNIMPESGKEVFVLARSLEATGWSTTGGRLLRPYLAKGARQAWAIKGVGGVKERSRLEIGLGVPEAVEFRTFQVQNFTGLDRTLRSAFLLGTALRAYQAEAKNTSWEEESDATSGKELSGIWKHFSNEARRIFSEYNIPDPQDAWRTPYYADADNVRAENLFKQLGDMLDEGRQHPQSRGAEFVAAMRGLIITTRKQIADITYKISPGGEKAV